MNKENVLIVDKNNQEIGSKPVSTLVEISATVRPECNIEIEVIAVKTN